MDEDNDRTIVPGAPLRRARTEVQMEQAEGENTLPVGTRLGEFEIIDLVGEGGFGIVYLAYDHSLDRHVALKEYMPNGLAWRSQTTHVTVRSRHYADTFHLGLKSFVNEARMLARFDSPSLVKVYRFWEDNGTAYMAMPFYEGLTLKRTLQEQRIVPAEDWIRALLANLLDALDTIHQVQCYHRDVAPDNILILKDGRPLLLDFGAARRVIGDLTQGPTVILKPGFAPVEQYADIPGLRQGAWTDIYALAAVVYFIVTGKAPMASIARIVKDEMEPLREAGKGRYSDRFLAAMDKALAVRPEHRIQSVAELRTALDLGDRLPRTMPSPAHGTNSGYVPQSRRIEPSLAANLAENATGLAQSKATEQHHPVALQPHRRSSMVVSATLLCTGISAGIVGYHWVTNRTPDATSVAQPGESMIAQEPLRDRVAPFTEGSKAGTGEQVAQNQQGNSAPSVSPSRQADSPPASREHVPAPVSPATTEKDSTKPTAIDRLALQAPVPQSRAVVPAPSAAIASIHDDEDWRAAGKIDTREAYAGYLSKHPNGKHAAAAKAMLDSKRAPVAVAPQSASREKRDAQENKAVVDPPDSSGKSGTSSVVTGSIPSSGEISRVEQKPTPVEAERKPPVNDPAPGPTVPSDRVASIPPGSAASIPGRTAGTSDIEPKINDAPALQEHSSQKSSTPAGERTLRLPGQTMVGNFTPDPRTGIVSGVGRIQWDNGDRFEGRMVKGRREGKGQFIWANGQRFSGDWAADQPNGKGTLIFANGNRYDGDVRNGEPHGQGKIRFTSGDVYSGGWLKGKHHGHGRYTWANGTYWEGEFRDGSKTENGKTVFASAASEPQAAVTSGSAASTGQGDADQGRQTNDVSGR